MTRQRVVNVRVETSAEAEQRKWFEAQVMASPDNLESAARLVIGLVTGLLGVVYGVLAVASDKLPRYMQLPAVRGLGAACIVLLLVSVLAGLVVVLPRPEKAGSAMPASQSAAFQRLLRLKSVALWITLVSFGLGVAALGSVLVITLLSV